MSDTSAAVDHRPGRTATPQTGPAKIEFSPESEYPKTIRVSEALRKVVDFVGRTAGWLAVPLVLVTMIDVVSRKLLWHDETGQAFGVQIWLTETFGRMFESTLLQEFEWHLHTGLWVLVLGYGYIWNTQVRVDLVREHLAFKKKAWIEFLGLTFFMLPYTFVVTYFAMVYAYDSFVINEISASQVGLPMRWVIKSVLVFGMLIACIAGISVWLQTVTLIWGRQDLRFPLMTIEWPEETGSKIEGKERLNLDTAVDELERRARESGHLNEPKATQ